MDEKFMPNGNIPDQVDNPTENVTTPQNEEPQVSQVSQVSQASQVPQAPQANQPINQIPNYVPPFQYANNQHTQPVGNTPIYNNPQQFQDNAFRQAVSNGQPTEEKKNKKKSGIGKIIFILLLCASVIAASVMIITQEPINNNATDDTPTTQNTNLDDNPVAPTAEDSPISFSEYEGDGPMTAEQIYNSVKDINVGVLVYSQNQMISEGSGIVFAKDSDEKNTYIVTAAHVIADKNVDVEIQFNDGEEIEAEIVGIDEKTDIGVLVIEGADYKTAVLGNSDNLSVGQTIYAIGNPGGTEFFGSFTSGMVSAIDRPVPTTNSSYDLPCIQHNAAINPGNSGGALVNEYGQVVGLNSSKISSTEYEGMGFAVPSNTLNEIYLQIIKYGYVTNRPMLGIQYYSVAADSTYSSIAWKNDLPYGSIVIAYVDKTSDLYNKIEIGDIITEVNGTELETTDILLETIENSKVNDTITLTVYRLNNNGTVKDNFKVKAKLIEDQGQNTIEEPEETNSFDPYDFFGY